MDRSVKRYQFKGVIPGKKSYAELQRPIEWLEKAGLVLKVKKCNRSEIPFETFCKDNMFNLFVFDIGLLGAMLDLPVNMIYTQDFGIIKGYSPATAVKLSGKLLKRNETGPIQNYPLYWAYWASKI